MPMTREQWEAQARRNAGGAWNPADAENQWQMHQLRVANRGQAGFENQGQNRGGTTAFASGPDATGMRAHALQYGLGVGAFDGFDEATLQVWEKYKDSNCPPSAPYAAMDGSGCVPKPIDSNSGAIHGGLSPEQAIQPPGLQQALPQTGFAPAPGGLLGAQASLQAGMGQPAPYQAPAPANTSLTSLMTNANATARPPRRRAGMLEGMMQGRQANQSWFGGR